MRTFHTADLDAALAANTLSSDDILSLYCGLDTCITMEVWQALEPDLRSHPPSATIYEFERQLQAPALEMMLRGILVDLERRDAKAAEFEAKEAQVCALLNELTEAAGFGPLNPRSYPRLLAFFYEFLRVPKLFISFKGMKRLSLNREALEKHKERFDALPFVNLILHARKHRDTLKFLRKGIDPDRRARTFYGVAATETGRWSSRRSAFGTGDNMQNQPPAVREIYVADPGYKLVNIDKEQAESRITGWYVLLCTGDSTYLDACESGDLHTLVAQMCFGVRDRADAESRKFYGEWSYRDVCKRLGHATNYLGSPWTLARLLHIPVRVVEDFQRRYFDQFPIPEWHRHTATVLQSTGELTTYMGRRRQFFGRLRDDATLREAVAYLAQSGQVDSLNEGLLRCWRAFGSRVQWLGQTHDSVLFQVPEDQTDGFCAGVMHILDDQRDLAGFPILHGDRRFCIPSEAKVGWRWCDGRSDPDGMVKWKPGQPDPRTRQHKPNGGASLQELLTRRLSA
jgi:DNA polymerase-1